MSIRATGIASLLAASLSAIASAQSNSSAEPTPSSLPLPPTAENRLPATDRTATATADGRVQSTINEWTIEINPRLWWVSPSGDIHFPGGSNDVSIEDLNLDTPELTPAGSLAINADRFRFSFFGASYSRNAAFTTVSPLAVGSISLLPTGPSESSFDLGMYELTVGYRFLQRDFKHHSETSAESADLILDLYGLAGARMYDLNIDVSQVGTGTSSVDEFFIEPIIGVRTELTIIRDFSVNLQLDGGGFGDSDRSSFSFNVGVDFQWCPLPWIGVQIGWRQVFYSFEDGDSTDKFKYDGALAGLFAGVVLRF